MAMILVAGNGVAPMQAAPPTGDILSASDTLNGEPLAERHRRHSQDLCEMAAVVKAHPESFRRSTSRIQSGVSGGSPKN
jgi:hypothetical protein